MELCEFLKGLKDYMKSFHIVVLYRLPSVRAAVWLNAY